jgi:hypothetical protein
MESSPPRGNAFDASVPLEEAKGLRKLMTGAKSLSSRLLTGTRHNDKTEEQLIGGVKVSG